MKTDKMIDGKVTALLPERRKDIQDQMKRYAEYITGAAEKLAKVEQELRETAEKWAEVIAKLRRAKLTFTTSRHNFDITVEVKRRQLRKVFDAIGRLNGRQMCKSIANAEKKLIRVSMDSFQYPFVTVTYFHKLKASDKCQIKTETPEPYQTLVCKLK